MSENFKQYEGSLSDEEFEALMAMTLYRWSTRETLERFLVEGRPMTDLPRTQRQFLRNKLVDLRTRGLLNQ